MTPIQEAMCAVIHESGMARFAEIARSAGIDYIEVTRDAIEQPYECGSIFRNYKAGPWAIAINHQQTLTQQEYEQWVKRKRKRWRR